MPLSKFDEMEKEANEIKQEEKQRSKANRKESLTHVNS